MSAPPLILVRAAWPEQDLAAWNALFSEGDLFEDGGPCADWSEGSRCKRAQSYGHWLGFLKRTNRLSTDTSPVDRFVPQTVRLFVEEMRARVALISTATQVADLFFLATCFDPDRDWSWFKSIADRLRHQTAQLQVKPRLGINSREIFEKALAEMNAAEAMETEDARMMRSVRFRDGLMMALLIARPLRLRAFIGMQLGTHLIERDGGYRLCFGAEDMKDRKPREFDLPSPLIEPMRRYVEHYRPALLKGSEATALWISQRGGPLSRDGFEKHLLHLTQRFFGVPMRPHAFRHVAATSIAEEDPAHVNVIASVLGHATLTMAEKHYNRATGVKAAAAFQKMVAGRRREAQKRARLQRQPTSTADIASTRPRVGRSAQ